jgi:hypothetical protein
MKLLTSTLRSRRRLPWLSRGTDWYERDQQA